MCVTNTTFLRQQPISLVPPGSANANMSGLTQRLLGTFQLKAPAKPHELHTNAPATYPTTSATSCGFMNSVEPQAPAVTSSMQLMQESSCALQQKPRPKRRRKPQKPGKTAKMNERHFVVHNYHDHATDTEESWSSEELDEEDEQARRKGGVAVAFPLKLHAILDQVEQDGLGHVISWQPHGRCFSIHQPKYFVETLMPKYFRQTKLTSFQRQLNLYGFCRLTKGPDAGGYYHELFLRGKTFLTKKMIRTKVKGTKFKAASSPDQEPDFYTMPPVVVSPNNSISLSPQSNSMSCDASMSDASLPPVNHSFPMYARQSMLDPTPFQFTMAIACPQQTKAAPMPTTSAASPTDDQVLDEAVEQLFLNAPLSDIGDLNDFVHDWDPSTSGRDRKSVV